jgi:hypothetical protein
MSDTNLEIVLKLIQQGDFKGAEAEIKKVTDATKKHGEEAEKGHSSHKVYHDLVKGLHTVEIPALTRAFHFLLNPMSLITATLGVGVALWREHTARVREAALAYQEMAHSQSTMGKGEIILAIAQANLKFAESQKKIKEEANSVATALNEETQAILANRRATEEIADSELVKRLEEIQNSAKPDSWKIVETEKAQEDARHRKDQARIAEAETLAEAESKRIGIARGELAKTQAGLPSAKEIEAAQKTAGHYAGQNETELPALQKQRAEMLKELSKLWEERTELLVPDAGSPFSRGERAVMAKGVDERINEKEAEIRRIDQAKDSAGKIAAAAKARAEDLVTKQTEGQSKINELTKTIEDSTRKLNVLMEEWERRKATAGAVSGNLDAAGQSEASRKAAEADQRDREQEERSIMERMKQGWRPQGGDLLDLDIDTGAGAAVNAAQKLGQATQAGFQEVATVLESHAYQIDQINSKVRSAAAVFAHNAF